MNTIIPESVTSIREFAFYRCSGLTSVTIPEGVTSIGRSAFEGCIGLTEVNYNAIYCYTMAMGETSVFNDCINLVTLNIGDNVQDIPYHTFYGCSGLTKVISLIENPIYIENAFSYETYANATLYVPMGTAEKYKAVEVWNYFASIVEGVENSIAQVREKEELIQAESGMIYVAGTDEGTSISVYSANGVLCGSAVSHNGSAVIGTDLPIGSIAIVKIGNKAVKVVVE